MRYKVRKDTQPRVVWVVEITVRSVHVARVQGWRIDVAKKIGRPRHLLVNGAQVREELLGVDGRKRARLQRSESAHGSVASGARSKMGGSRPTVHGGCRCGLGRRLMLPISIEQSVSNIGDACTRSSEGCQRQGQDKTGGARWEKGCSGEQGKGLGSMTRRDRGDPLGRCR